jgi:transcriptional regulator with XRE-family HTH domain
MTADEVTKRQLVEWANKVRRARRLRGWSQAELAEVSGVAKRTIASVESPNEHHAPTWRTLVSLAEAFDADPATFFRGAKLPRKYTDGRPK